MRKTQNKKPANLIVRGGGLLLFALAAALIIYFAYSWSVNFWSGFTVMNLPGLAIVNTPTLAPGELPSVDATPAPPEQVIDLGPTPQPWDGASRVTMLVVGLDFGDWSEDREGPSRTDTMVLLTVDPLTKSAGILNIPRDLWVSIPGFGYGKINTAYYLGEANQMPGGGPAMATKAVENLLGVKIDYFAQVDFFVFERFIDEIGGVVVNVQYEMKIDPIGKYNTKTLLPGEQRLMGPDALAYVRARYTEGGDFDRAQRQQEVIMEIRRRVTKPSFFPILLSKASELYTELAPGIKTNMSFDEAIQFAWLAQQIAVEDIRRGAIAPPEQVLFAKSPDGTQDILKPIPDKIRETRDYVFGIEDAASPLMAATDPLELMKQEGARISILNGSGIEGLASRTQTYLAGLGANVPSVGNGEYLVNSKIISYTGKPYTVRYLVELLGIPENNIYIRYDPNAAVDVELTLGADWGSSNPMP